jgi:hypothetical protein
MVDGKGGVIWICLEGITENTFSLKNSEFINCTSKSKSSHAVYLNVKTSSNEEFLFDTITLTYTEPTKEAVLFLNIYNLNGIVGSTSDRLKTFKSKFNGFCLSPPNTTSFIVYDVENISQHEYTLPELICDRESLLLSILICFFPFYLF